MDSDLSNLRISMDDLTDVILRAKTIEKRHLINMRRNSKTSNLVSSVQINGSLVLLVIQEAKVGIVYSAPGWDTRLQTILGTAKPFKINCSGRK
jgi:hypothetical protein